LLDKVYAQNYYELEAMFLEAKKVRRTDDQEKRFLLLEDNFSVLQWRLKNLKLLKPSYKSTLTTSGSELAEMIAKDNNDFQTFPGVVPINRLIPDVPKFDIGTSRQVRTKDQKARLSNENKNTYMLFSREKQVIKMKCKTVDHGSWIAAYVVKDENNKLVTSGILIEGAVISFQAKANTAYYVYIPARGKISYNLIIDNSEILKGSFKKSAITISEEVQSRYGVCVQNISGKEVKLSTPGEISIN